MVRQLRFLAGAIVSLTTILGGAWALENHWTPRVMLVDFQKQYQKDRDVDLLDRTNDRLFDLRQKLKKDPDNEELLKEIDSLENRKKRLEKQLDPEKKT